jgi:hypothetical protein
MTALHWLKKIIQHKRKGIEMDRRDFLLATTVAAGAVAAIAAPEIAASAKAPVNLLEMTLAQIAAAFADGRMTSRRLTQFYLDRIGALDRRGPALGAVLTASGKCRPLAILAHLGTHARKRPFSPNSTRSQRVSLRSTANAAIDKRQ